MRIHGEPPWPVIILCVILAVIEQALAPFKWIAGKFKSKRKDKKEEK